MLYHSIMLHTIGTRKSDDMCKDIGPSLVDAKLGSNWDTGAVAQLEFSLLNTTSQQFAKGESLVGAEYLQEPGADNHKGEDRN